MIYFDNAATEFIYTDKNYAWMNPNTKYAYEAHNSLNESYKKMRELLNVKTGMIIFGGQNGSQLVDLLYAKCHYKSIRFHASRFEHDIIYSKSIKTFKTDEEAREHIEYNYKCGYRDMFCRMFVNNITGEVFYNNEVGKMCRDCNQYFLMDCTSAIGHVELPKDFEQWCDCIVISGHKFGGGYMGCMWLSDRLCKELYIDTPSDLSSGTLSANCVHDIVYAFEISANIESCSDLMVTLCDNLLKNRIAFQVIDKHSSPQNSHTFYINAIRLFDINADALQQYLASENIYIGRGASSCDSNDDSFRVLQAYGLSAEDAKEVIRLSFGPWNTSEEVIGLVNAIKKFKDCYIV